MALRIVAWFWLFLTIMLLLSFIAVPSVCAAIIVLLSATGSIGLLYRKAFAWWIIVLASAFCALVSLVTMIANAAIGGVSVILFGSCMFFLIKDRPRQWNLEKAEDEVVADNEQTPDIASIQTSSVPQPIKVRTPKATNTKRRMVDCPSCGYPNIQGRKICFKCHVALPPPTTMQRITEICLSWNAVCLAVVVLTALLIFKLAQPMVNTNGQGINIRPSQLPPPAQNSITPSVQQPQQSMPQTQYAPVQPNQPVQDYNTVPALTPAPQYHDDTAERNAQMAEANRRSREEQERKDQQYQAEQKAQRDNKIINYVCGNCKAHAATRACDGYPPAGSCGYKTDDGHYVSYGNHSWHMQP